MTSTTIHYRICQKCLMVISLLALLFFTPDTAVAQGWLRHYLSGTGEEPRQLVIAPNGDFVFGGVEFTNNQTLYYLQRNDANGNKIWYKTIDPSTQPIPAYLANMNFLENCPDGGFVAGGSMKLNGIYVEVAFKVSALGDPVWIFTPDPTRHGFFNSAAIAPDGNVLIGGTREVGPIGQELMTPFLHKLNSTDGSLVWVNSYPEHHGSEFGSSILYNAAGNIMQAGSAGDSVFLRFISGDGDLFNKIGFEGSSSQYPTLRNTVSGGYSLTIHRSDGTIWYRRFANSGNLLNLKVSNGPTFNSNIGTYATNGYAYTITQLAGPGIYETPALYKMDFDGNISAAIYPIADFSLNAYYLAQNIKSTADGGFIIIGANLGQPTWFALKTDSLGHIDPGVVLGNVFRDNDLDCIKSAGEPNLFPIQVRATDLTNGTAWYETTDSSGNFALVVPTGDYDIEALEPSGATGFWKSCPPVTAMLPTAGDTVSLPPLGLQPLVSCPFLQLDLGALFFRPCSTTVLTVKVLNAGTADTDSSTVMLEVDPALTFVSSTAPLLAQIGNLFWFDAGPVASLQSTQFTVSFMVDCSAQLGQVLCLDGHVTPDSLCAPPNILWDGAELKIRAICNNDSIRFRVSNIGAGDMNQPSQLVIIEDYIILRTLLLKLPAGQDTLISLPNPNGQTYYGRIRQTQGFPGDAYASDGEDFCAANGSTGMLLQYPLFAGGPFDARFCDEVRTAFDPNDKRGFPFGYGPSHYIDPGTPIQYMIRFQNTGNDTAFNITLRDTLPAQLDRASLRIGSSSHPFSYEMTGEGVLVFRFPNVLLPDSTTNELLSHGFVQFELLPKLNLAPGTLVENRAAIYFDFNAPVFTEYARHTVDSNFIPTLSVAIPQTTGSLSVVPNPSNESTTLNLETSVGEGSFPLLLTVTDVLGKTLRQELVVGLKHILQRGDLPAGLCFLKLEHENGVVLAVGKVVWGL